ncbi:MAG: hypothetical protein HQL52_18380 [Magnetococcales bacterium]|nr:hypothetical protein [Magnetococcales bacterium]
MFSPLLQQCENQIQAFAQEFMGNGAGVSIDTPLLGRRSPFKSHQIVELLVAVEDYCDEKLGVEFDWTGKHSDFETWGIYSTIGTLARYIASLPPKDSP